MINDDILAHARQCAPAESCGYVVRTAQGERYFPCENLSAEPTMYFRISPEDYLNARNRGDIVALVHSHPDGKPCLSSADRTLQIQSGLDWWLVCDNRIHKFRCVPHLTGRQFEHGVIEAREFVGDICGSKVMQGVSIRATNDERSTSTRYTDSATYQIGKTITVMANCERNGGSGAITVTININGQVKTAEVMPYTAGIPAMYQTVVFSVYTTSPVVDISVSLRVRGQYTTSASVWPLVMVSRSGSNFTN